METFKPQTLSIAQLFGNEDNFYKIPNYQRPYKWLNEQVEQLWDDIFEAYENNLNDYFLGSVITSKSDGDIDIIDGQQRMTTLMILFCVVRNLYENINANSEDRTAIDKTRLNNFICFNGKVDRLKMLTDPQYMSDFKELIINMDLEKIKKQKNNDLKNDEQPKFKFLNTAFIFKEKLIDLGEKKSASFINYLFNKVFIIRIDCTDVSSAIKIFQILNDRGLDLSPSDLIKSSLLQNINDKFKNASENEKQTQKHEIDEFISKWREAENTLKDTDITISDMFVLYEYYLLAQNPKKGLFDELSLKFKTYKDGDANKIISEFVKFCELYSQKLYYNEDKIINSMWYIRWKMHWKAIVLTAIHRNFKDLKKLLFSLRRFYYLYWISGYTLSKIKHTSFLLIKWIKDGESIESIDNKIDEKMQEDGILEYAKDALSGDIYGTAWCRPLLATIEYNLTDDSKQIFIELDNKVQVEHILPQKYKNQKSWKHITDEIAQRYINTGGNITLLSGYKNVVAANLGLAQKINTYKDKNTGISAFEMTRLVVGDFESGKYNKEWSEAAIEDRYAWFCSQIYEIFNLNIKL